MNKRTDLALESAELYWETSESREIDGVLVEEAGDEEIRITRVEIISEEGEKTIGKQQGKYITIELPSLVESDSSVLKKASQFLSDELRNMMGERKLTLVCGLGNSEITPDSLGPKVNRRLVVTRHLFSYMPDSVEHLAPVCALAPGVLGITGIETVEIIKGVVDRISPDLVIVVDALASRKTERVSSTIQISDSGISPGSGVGNRRKAINRETIGVPVIAVGVPMVVDAATIANDTIDLVMGKLIEQVGEELNGLLQNMDRDEKHQFIRQSLPKEMEMMVVTPKDIDMLSDKIALVVANGINHALHSGITDEEIEAFVS